MNIPIVGQTFEIDGYKSIECTADANADAKAFAKANGIPVSEAKYILETLYGSARQTQSAADKATEGVTNTTPDEDAEVAGTDAEIMDAIDNLTTALEDNENVDQGILKQITTLLSKLLGGTATTKDTVATTTQDTVANATNKSNNDNTDIAWDKLEVEGKGVNLNNLTNILQDAVDDYKANNKNKAINYEEIYQSLSAEEKAVVDKFLPNGASKKELKALFQFFDNGGKERLGADLSILALATSDADGDGFLTDDEIASVAEDIQKNSKNISKYLENLTKKELKKYGVVTTTINGKTVYFTRYAGSSTGGRCIALTEDEMAILDKYLNDEEKDKYVGSGSRKTGADIHPIWEALGAEFVQKNKDDDVLGHQVLTNSAGITSAIFENGERCSACDNRLYQAYQNIKKAMAKNNS